MQKLLGAFFVLGSGWMASTLALIVEVVIERKNEAARKAKEISVEGVPMRTFHGTNMLP